MGQLVNALMLGVKSSMFEKIDDFDDFIQDLDGKEPRHDNDCEVVGYCFAIGRDGDSNDDDVPALDEPIAITAIESVYADAIAIARARWSTFAAFAKENNVDIGEPAIYIVTVEVA
jgi:hypothetical protein